MPDVQFCCAAAVPGIVGFAINQWGKSRLQCNISVAC
jgi:hypothetical protein